MNRRRRILTILACGFVAMLLAAMFSTRRSDGVRVSAIDELNDTLIQSGFTNVYALRWVDEALIEQVPGVRSLVAKFYPDFHKEGMNRSFSKDGSKLGIDYTLRRGEALDISVSADAAHCARARKIVRDLSALNPNLSVRLRTNDPPIAAKR